MAHGKGVQPKQDEIVGLAEQVLLTAGRGKLTDASRARLQAELAKRNFASLRAYAGSLVEDPAQAGIYYLAADAMGGSVSPADVAPTLPGPRSRKRSICESGRR